MEGLEWAYSHQYQMDLDWSHLKLESQENVWGETSSEQIIYQTVKIFFWRSWLCRAKIGESEGSMRPLVVKWWVTFHYTKQKLGIIRIFSNNERNIVLCRSSNFSVTCAELLFVSAIRAGFFFFFPPHGAFNFPKSIAFPFSGTIFASLTGQSY